MIESMARMGRNLTDGPNWGAHLRAVGFTDVIEHRFNVPFSSWAKGRKNKILGAMSQQNLTEGVESMGTAAFTRVLGWTPERAKELSDGAKEDLADTGVHAYCWVVVVYGRKPVAVE